MIHGSRKHIENVLSGIQGSGSDPGALANGFFPLPLRTHLAEPERVSAALEGPDRVNTAALIIEPAAAVRVFDNAETRCKGPQMNPGQIGCGYFEKISQSQDFRLADTDDAGISRAAGAAAPAFKTNSGVKKIPAVILIVRVAFHMGFDL